MALDWRIDKPPTIPIYFCSIDKLREVCENGEYETELLGMLLDYFVYFEKFEEAAVIKDIMDSSGIVTLDIEDIKTRRDFDIPELLPGTPDLGESFDDLDEDGEGTIMFD